MSQLIAPDPLLSVAICTYNRPDLLPGAIESILMQDLERSAFELLIIDNHPDALSHSAFAGCLQDDVDMRYFHESRVGLSHARNRARDEARGRYVLYIDDDARLPKGYLARAAGIAHRLTPDAFGGPYLPWYRHNKPAWYCDRYGSVHPEWPTHRLAPNEYLFGSNMAFRLDCLPPDPFDPDFGMTGMRMAYGEEVALQKVLRQMGHNNFLFDHDLAVFHLVPDWKMRLSWRIRSQFAAGKHFERSRVRESHGDQIVLRDDFPSRLKDFAFGILSVLRSFTLGLFTRNRLKYPYWQQYVYEDTAVRVANLGVALERVLHPRATKGV